MTDIYQKLFSTYGTTVLGEAEGGFRDWDIYARLEPLRLDRRTEDVLADLFCEYYHRWSADAFALGVHLGFTLIGDISR